MMATTTASGIRRIDDAELAATTGGTKCVSALGWTACGYFDRWGIGGAIGNGKKSYSVDVTFK